MMNTKTSPSSHLYKYLFVLPLIAATYFFVAPLNAESLQTNSKKVEAERRAQNLKTFEGYYKFTFNNEPAPSYIQIIAKDTNLVLKQLWDGQEIVFKQTGPLEFLCAERNFPLKFTKDSKGIVMQVLAFNRDLWNRTEEYKPTNKVAIRLSQEQLKTFEGTYELGDRAIRFIAIDDGLLLKQQWDGKEIAFLPENALNFFCADLSFTLKFTKNNAGAVTQVLALNKDLWVKTNK